MAIAALMGVGTAIKGEEVPSLDLNFDGTTSSYTRATTSPTAPKANGDQLATSIVTQNKGGTVQSKYMGPNGKLINGYVTNLLTQSSDLTHSDWTASNVGVTANQVDPAGGTGAFLIEDSSTNYGLVRQQVTGVAGSTYTASLFVKQTASAASELLIRFKGLTEANRDCNLDTSTGDISGSPDIAVQDYNGWWRISVTTTLVSATTLEFTVYPAHASSFNGTPDATATTTAGTHIVYGPQIEEGAAPSELVQTTSGSVSDQVARVEYDASGNPLGLLVEEQRTNLWPSGQSNFGNATAGGGSTASTTAVTAPDGTTNNIWAITESGTAGSHHAYTGISVSASTAYTASYYLKKGSEDYGFVYFEGTAFSGIERVWFDLVNGTVGTETGSSVGRISDAGNGWYRCSVTTTSGTTLTNAFASVGFSSVDGNFNSSGASAVTGYYWGMQVEQGEGPTSLIYDDTTGSVIRPADDITVSTSDFGFDVADSSTVIEASLTSEPNSSFPRLFEYRGSSTAYRIFGRVSSGNLQVGFADSATGTSLTSSLATGVTYPLVTTAGVAHTGTDISYGLDGDGAGSATSSGMSTALTTLKLGGQVGVNTNIINGHIRRFTYWPRAINDAQLSKFTNQ